MSHANIDPFLGGQHLRQLNSASSVADVEKLSIFAERETDSKRLFSCGTWLRGNAQQCLPDAELASASTSQQQQEQQQKHAQNL